MYTSGAGAAVGGQHVCDSGYRRKSSQRQARESSQSSVAFGFEHAPLPFQIALLLAVFLGLIAKNIDLPVGLTSTKWNDDS